MSAGAMNAATFLVVNTLDRGPGSLRRAITDANATTAPDTIIFAIPEIDPGFDPTAGVWTIKIASTLELQQPVLIDGYTQTGARPNTNGPGKGLNTILKVVVRFNVPTGSGLATNYFVRDCTIRGLVFNGVVGSALLEMNEGPQRIEGNFFGTDAFGDEAGASGASHTSAQIAVALGFGSTVVGGPAPEQRNLFAGRTMHGVSAHIGQTIQGNLFGTTVDGTAAQPLRSGISATARNQIGGAIPGAGNVLVSSGGEGTFTVASYHQPANPQDSGANVIEGNLIGTDVTGEVALAGHTVGLYLESNGNQVGGASLGQGNVISGNPDGGIRIQGQNNGIMGNYIGTDANGTKALPNRYGISILGDFSGAASGNQVGGRNTGEGNVIAFNRRAGVVLPSGRNTPGVRGDGYGTFLRNQIFANGRLGIDLGADGVTLNDDDDDDLGPNSSQNYPVLTSAVPSGGSLIISGRLQSHPNRTYRVEFFAATAADRSGHGEGRFFIGAAGVRTNSDGTAAFNTVCNYREAAPVISATATNPGVETSEFSRAITVSTAPTQLLNLSARALVGPRDETLLIGGFIVRGSERKKVIVRALGASLRNRVAGALPDPTLELYDGSGEAVASNDNWRDTQQAEISNSGLAPEDDADAAIVATLETDQHYTVAMRGKNNASGIGLLEIYDLDQGSSAQLVNISTRGWVDAGDQVLIGGMIAGTGSGRTEAVVRAIGPSLARSGTDNALPDPMLELRNRDGELILANNNWKDDPKQANEIRAAGLAPQRDLESAIATTLPPGASTAILRSGGNATGVALVEVYHIQSQ